MAITKALTAAAVLLLTTAVAPAFAHDDQDDHEDHWRIHRDLSKAHRLLMRRVSIAELSTVPIIVH
jgi:hypothetical protein